VVEDGVSGFIVPGEEQAVHAVGRLRTLDRYKVRTQFEQRFTAKRMAQDYLKCYGMILGKAASRSEAAVPPVRRPTLRE
jgi:hypothetical protein